MSLLAPNEVKAESPSNDDLFKSLSEGDELDSLDLTTPLKKPAEKDKKQEAKPEEKEEGKETEEEEEETEEIDELAELEEELSEPDESKLELAAPVPRREIIAKYPNLFKEFPYLEKAYYRDMQFTKLFSHPKEAEKALEDSNVLARYSEDMIENGNVGNVLKMIKDSNPDTFNNVVDNYLENLHKIDQGAYQHVIAGVVKNIIIGMVQEAKESGDDDLRTAALLLNKHAFGSSKFVPHAKLGKNSDPDEKKKESELTERERKFIETQMSTAENEITSRVDSSIKGFIESNIDPNKSMTDYVKRNAVRDAVSKVKELIDKDVRFGKIVEKMWEKAAKSNFSKNSLDDIKKAYLSRARTLLAPVIKSARNEALKGMGRKVKEEDIENKDEKSEKSERERSTERRSSSDKTKTQMDSLRGKSSYEALQSLMGD